MAVHRETFGEDVGGKLLLLASLLAVFGVIALILLPLGAAFSPPPAPPAAEATATPDGSPAPAETAPADTATTPAASAEGSEAPAAEAAPAEPPSVIGALMPGIIMLVIAAILAVLAGLLLGHSKARSEEAGPPPATPPLQ